MSLVQNLNQFAPTPGLGQPMKGIQPSTHQVRFNPSSSSTTGVQVGSPMKLIANTSSGEIIVDLAGATDSIFGVIPANTKKNTYVPGDVLDLFCDGNCLMLEATAAINAGSYLAIGNTSAAGGGPGVTTTAVAGAQYGAQALTSVSAGATAILVKIKTGQIAPITTYSSGTVTLAAGAATVAATGVTANSQILTTLKTVGGTIASKEYVATITPGTGFTLAGGGGSNTSVLNWAVLN